MKTFKSLLFFLMINCASYTAFADGHASHAIDSNKSELKWYGSKIVGGAHDGTINIKSGSLKWEKGILRSGDIVIDMTSIVNSDIKSEKLNKKLVGHLRSDDFFSVAKHKVATFKTTKVQSLKGDLHRLWGKMTIKGITKEVDFLVRFSKSGNSLSVIGEIKLDRTDFDVKYGSGKFFDDLGDKMISDEIKLNFTLVSSLK